MENPECLFDIECYDENRLKNEFTELYDSFIKVIEMIGIDLSKYEFSQFIRTKHNSENYDEITYSLNEDISLNVSFWNNEFESILLARD